MSPRIALAIIGLCAVVGLQDRLPVDKLAKANFEAVAAKLAAINEGLGQ